MKSISEKQAYELYDEFLDEVYGTIEICGLSYEASYAFKRIDPTAYDCGMSDWLDSENMEIQ